MAWTTWSSQSYGARGERNSLIPHGKLDYADAKTFVIESFPTYTFWHVVFALIIGMISMLMAFGAASLIPRLRRSVALRLRDLADYVDPTIRGSRGSRQSRTSSHSARTGSAATSSAASDEPARTPSDDSDPSNIVHHMIEIERYPESVWVSTGGRRYHVQEHCRHLDGCAKKYYRKCATCARTVRRDSME